VHADADIELDFLADWYALMRDSLRQVGFASVPTGGQELELAYFNLLKRVVPIAKRRVHIGAGLVCPPEHLAGYQELTRKVQAGEDLRPYHSKRILDLDYNEGQLNDWGIHHLHLGAKMEPTGVFIERTGPVLYARFRSEHAYFITIQKHGAWSDLKLLEELDANWPNLLASVPTISARGPNPTDREIAAARRAGVQALVHVNGKVVMPMGGGMTTKSGKGSAVGASVISDMGRCRNEVRRFEALVVANKDQVFSEAKAKGVELRRPVRFNLHVRSDSVAIAITADNAFGFPLGPLWR
jgi:hypothetical protein